jgi:multidrug transporter EmrE-like cation transporter
MGRAMKRWFIIGFFALVAFDTMGQIGFKLTAEKVGAVEWTLDWFREVLSTPSFLMIAGAYVLAFFTYMTLMKDVHVGPLFAAAHLELVTVTVFSFIWFGERFTPVQMIGCLLIVGGVVILGLTEEAETPRDAA